jgi:acetyl-CoA carboxylase carboxyltransferase component
MMDIINRLVDNSEFEAYKDGYGQTIITGYTHRRLGSKLLPTNEK